MLYDSVQEGSVMELATGIKSDTQTITVRVNREAKKQAEAILEDIGLTFTGLINACVKAVVRERRVPFDMISSEEYELQQMIRVKLEESEVAANDPIAKRYTHEEIFAPLRKKYGYEVQD
jgi:addiction module RelB/DinJ family antitoxin